MRRHILTTSILFLFSAVSAQSQEPGDVRFGLGFEAMGGMTTLGPALRTTAGDVLLNGPNHPPQECFKRPGITSFTGIDREIVSYDHVTDLLQAYSIRGWNANVRCGEQEFIAVGVLEVYDNDRQWRVLIDASDTLINQLFFHYLTETFEDSEIRWHQDDAGRKTGLIVIDRDPNSEMGEIRVGAVNGRFGASLEVDPEFRNDTLDRMQRDGAEIMSSTNPERLGFWVSEVNELNLALSFRIAAKGAMDGLITYLNTKTDSYEDYFRRKYGGGD